MSDRPETLEVGYVSRAHGLAGEVAVRTFDSASETLLTVERVVLRSREGTQTTRNVLSARPATKDFLVHLEGIDDRNAAEALVGSTVLAYREDLGPLEAGEYFQGDLVGLTAVTEAGEVLGEVKEVWNSGPVPNLVVVGPGKPELMVPFADPFVASVDMKNRRVVVRPLEYLE